MILLSPYPRNVSPNLLISIELQIYLLGDSPKDGFDSIFRLQPTLAILCLPRPLRPPRRPRLPKRPRRSPPTPSSAFMPTPNQRTTTLPAFNPLPLPRTPGDLRTNHPNTTPRQHVSPYRSNLLAPPHSLPLDHLVEPVLAPALGLPTLRSRRPWTTRALFDDGP